MNVFLADWTVGPGHFLHTFMGILEVVGQTHVALVAVEVLAPPTNLQCFSSRSNNENVMVRGDPVWCPAGHNYTGYSRFPSCEGPGQPYPTPVIISRSHGRMNNTLPYSPYTRGQEVLPELNNIMYSHMLPNIIGIYTL